MHGRGVVDNASMGPLSHTLTPTHTTHTLHTHYSHTYTHTSTLHTLTLHTYTLTPITSGLTVPEDDPTSPYTHMLALSHTHAHTQTHTL